MAVTAAAGTVESSLTKHRGVVSGKASATAALDAAPVEGEPSKHSAVRLAEEARGAQVLAGSRADAAGGVAGGGNDSCFQALPILAGLTAFNNAAATTDGPDHATCEVSNQTGIAHDVWYCWQAPSDCTVTVNTCPPGQTSVDTKIAAYDGCACPVDDARLLACDDDACGNQSRISFDAVSGQSYLIRIGTFPLAAGGTGTFTLECIPPPVCTQPDGQCQLRNNANADTSDRTNFTVADGFSPALSGSVNEICWWGAYSGATANCEQSATDAFEVKYYADVDGFPGALIASYSQAAGTLTVAGPSPTGDIVSGLVPEYAYTGGHAPVPVSAGQCYWVEVTNSVSDTDCIWFWERALSGDGRAVQDGNPIDGYGLEDVRLTDQSFCLDIPLGDPGVCQPPIPANDDCANSTEVFDGITLFETTGATTDGPAEPACNFQLNDDQINADIWFDYVATCSEVLQVSLCGSRYDTKLAVYDGGACPPTGALTACDDDFCDLQSQVSFPVVQGEAYKIRVGGFKELGQLPDTGPGQLQITCMAPPPNDNCTDVTPQPLAQGQPIVYTGSNGNSSNDCPIFPGPHVWIAFDLLADGSVTLDYSGTDPVFSDAWLNLATGCPCSGITAAAECQVAAPDGNLEISWDCLPAGTYYYPVLADTGSQGPYRITVSTEPCRDRCAGGVGDCMTAHPTPGCDDPECCATVCGRDDYCCCVEWDATCASIATTLCGLADTCAAATGDCCTPQTPGTGGCADFDCCMSVCECSSFCCNVTWDSACATDGWNGDGCGANLLCGDTCAGCPDGAIAQLDPPAGWFDARQPHSAGSTTPQQGYDTIVVSGPTGAEAIACWSVCETTQNAARHPAVAANAITSVVSNGPGQYTLTLAHPLTPGEITKITYAGGTGSSVSLTAHPGDVNGDGVTDPSDIIGTIDCINMVAAFPCESWNTDLDRSGVLDPSDIITVIDLLNGASAYESWFGATVVDTGECP